MKKYFFFLLLILLVTEIKYATAQSPYMVKDISASTSPKNSSAPSHLANINGVTYFAADDGIHGTELWKSDGSPEGTVLVKDINNGTTSSAPIYLTNVNGVLYFSADDGINGIELWKSDGTALGTVLVKDINPGVASASPDNLTNVNGVLFFVTINVGLNSNRTQLRKSDGTNSGTVLVAQLSTSPTAFGISEISNLTAVNGVLFFSQITPGPPSSFYLELWKSDGTTAGTILIKTIGSSSLIGGLGSLNSFINVNGILFFNGFTSGSGQRLWKSDGTSAGTVPVGLTFLSPANLTLVNGFLFFTGNDAANGFELWKTDGTDIGTTLVKDINIGTTSSTPSYLTNVNGTLYFSANDGINGAELWKTDGTGAGTVQVKDINTGISGSNPSNLTNVNGLLYFSANDGVNGIELWKSTGTSAGTVLVNDIIFGIASSNPVYLINANGLLLFNANDNINGNELWKTDGTSYGTLLIKDINTSKIISTPSSSPGNLANVNGQFYFTADDGNYGVEIWKSDGRAAGTVIVKDIRVGLGPSDPTNLTGVNGILYFSANDGINGTEIWKTDGTGAGTVQVKDINTGLSGSNPSNLTNVNGVLYFTANNSGNGNELWKTDGTDAGTVLVKDINTGTASSDPGNLTNVNGVLYFTATNGTNGVELWKTDGTTASTVIIKDIVVGVASSNPAYLTNVNGVLYFNGTDYSDGVNNREIWKSDGTAAGTVLVKDIVVGVGSSIPANLTNLNGILYFSAVDAVNGKELWKSDGTSAGTVLVKDINVGNLDSSPTRLTNANGVLYFISNNGVNGIELWKSDGTSAGTVLVKDIFSGISTSNPNYLTFINGVLYFSANDGINGNELWKSDGTSLGTLIVKDLNTGATNSNPSYLVDATNGITHKLLFSATQNIPNTYYGTELWALGNCGVSNSILTTQAISYNQEQQTSPNTQSCNCDMLNNLLNSVDAVGLNPAVGIINSKAWMEITQPLAFVKRHYEITPFTNSNTATGKITLYFTQQEFTDFNAVNILKLPITSSDAVGKANLLIEKRLGISSDSSGLPISYSGPVVTINPADADIVWNALLNRWEVSFDVTGFGGFFVKTSTAPIPNIYTFNGNGNWNVAANWVGGIIPPAILPAPSEIIINPISGGECFLQLNTAQTIASGAKLTVIGAKKLRVEGSLIIQ
jgi:ELWxxDGT repeat protein